MNNLLLSPLIVALALGLPQGGRRQCHGLLAGKWGVANHEVGVPTRVDMRGDGTFVLYGFRFYVQGRYRTCGKLLRLWPTDWSPSIHPQFLAPPGGSAKWYPIAESPRHFRNLLGAAGLGVVNEFCSGSPFILERAPEDSRYLEATPEGGRQRPLFLTPPGLDLLDGV